MNIENSTIKEKNVKRTTSEQGDVNIEYVK